VITKNFFKPASHNAILLGDLCDYVWGTHYQRYQRHSIVY